MARALVALANGFEDIEAISVIDILRRGGIDVVAASVHETTDVTSAHGVPVRADALFADVADDAYEAIVLPGGGEGTSNLAQCEQLIERLRRQKEEELLICAICAAPTILVNAGLLDEGQHVTCYPTCSVDLDRPCANVPAVADGCVITGQAPGSAMLFALVILQHLIGDNAAQKIARGLVTDVI